MYVHTEVLGKGLSRGKKLEWDRYGPNHGTAVGEAAGSRSRHKQKSCLVLFFSRSRN